MARYLALEWDAREARAVVATLQRGSVQFEQALAVPLAAAGGEPNAADVGRRLAAELAARRLGRIETLVAVGRASIELKLLTLPPAPDAELPDLVRFQAQREFNTLGDAWPLDFLSIGADPSQPRTVLAAAISPQLVGQISDTCRQADLVPKRLILRPCAAASLLRRRRPAESGRVRLLVDLVDDEADLTVLAGETIVFMRTARLPSSHAPGDMSQALLTEIRRTLAAVHNQLGAQRVERAYLCGLGDEYAALAEQIDAQLKLPVERFDPFDGLDLSAELQRQLPPNAGRYAPLLGMLVDEAAGVRHSIDFLNPTQKPQPPDRRRAYALAGGAAAVVTALVLALIWFGLAGMDDDIASLRTQITQNTQELKKLADENKLNGSLDEWMVGDMTWLDELGELSREFAPGDEAVLTSLNISSHKTGGAMRLDGTARSTAVIEAFDTRLRDARHGLESHGDSQDAKNLRYPWQFHATVTVQGDPALVAAGPRGVTGRAVGRPVNSRPAPRTSAPARPAASPASTRPAR